MTCFNPEQAHVNLETLVTSRGEVLLAAGAWFAISPSWDEMRVAAVTATRPNDPNRQMHVIRAHCSATGDVTITHHQPVSGVNEAINLTRTQSLAWNKAGDSQIRPRQDPRKKEVAARGNPLRTYLVERVEEWQSGTFGPTKAAGRVQARQAERERERLAKLSARERQAQERAAAREAQRRERQAADRKAKAKARAEADKIAAHAVWLGTAAAQGLTPAGFALDF